MNTNLLPNSNPSMALPKLFVLVLLLSTVNAASLYDTLKSLNATTFLSLVDQVHLDTDLKVGGPYTLLVPTNAAFAKIPASDLAAVKNDPYAIMNVIKYHISSGVHNRNEFLFGRHYFLNSTNGHVLRVLRSATGLHFNQATAVKTDIDATNGVIHLINTVLDVPEGTVVDILQNQDYNISKFYDLIQKAHLQDNYAHLTGINRYTMFAPSNAAMDAVPQSKIDALSKDYTYLRILVEYHVHSGTLHASSIAKRHSITTTLPNHRINITTNAAGDIMLNGKADVVLPDIEGENGVVHVISSVLFPQILTSGTDVIG